MDWIGCSSELEWSGLDWIVRGPALTTHGSWDLKQDIQIGLLEQCSHLSVLQKDVLKLKMEILRYIDGIIVHFTSNGACFQCTQFLSVKTKVL